MSGRLPADVAEAVSRHLDGCGACAAEAEALADTWHALGALPGEPPPAGMRARFDAMLDDHRAEARQTSRRARARQAAWWAAAAALFVIGVAVGRLTTPPAAPEPRLAELRDEIRALREMTAIALLQLPSPTDRLTGVTWTGQIDRPGSEVASVLLDTLMRDPNANVRLAAIDALRRLADREAVRRGAVDALAHQSSPMVQIALIDFVAELNGPEAAAALRRVSSDPLAHTAVRARAAAVLQKVG